MQLDWLDGEMTDRCGQDRHPANPSPQQESKTAQVTSDIYGLSGSISSGSADLQSFLENRLARRLHSVGSMPCNKTWKTKATPAGRSYCQLQVSALRTSEIGSGSWLTPTTSDMNGIRKLDGKRSGGLNTQAQSIWPTPMSADNRDRGKWDDPAIQRRVKLRKSIELSMLVGSVAPNRNTTRSPWPTPTHHNAKENGYPGESNRKTVPLGAMRHMISGQIQKSFTVETESTEPSQLNPKFSLWLMGYPIEWGRCAERVTPLSRRSRQKS